MTRQLVVYSAGTYSPDVHKLVCTPCSHLRLDGRDVWGVGAVPACCSMTTLEQDGP